MDLAQLERFVADLRPAHPLQQRLQRAREVAEFIRTNRLDVGSLSLVWSCVADLMHERQTSEARLAGYRIACSIAGSSNPEPPGLLCLELYRIVESDQGYIKVRLEVLKALTRNGRNIAPFSDRLGPLVVRWMADGEARREAVLFATNVVNFSAATAGEALLAALISGACAQVLAGRDAGVVRCCVGFLAVAVRRTTLPASCVEAFNAALCHAVNLDPLSRQAWPIMKAALGSGAGQAGLRALAGLLDGRRGAAEAPLVRGAVFFLGMAAWGSTRVPTLRYPFSAIVAAMQRALSCPHPIVPYEVLLALRRLLRKYGPELRGEWEGVVGALRAVRPLLPPGTEAPVARVFQDCLAALHGAVEEGAFAGDPERFYALAEEAGEHAPAGLLARLLAFRCEGAPPAAEAAPTRRESDSDGGAGASPGQAEWRGRLGELMARYFAPGAREEARLACLQLLRETLWEYRDLYDEEVLEGALLPHLQDVGADASPAVRAAGLALVADALREIHAAPRHFSALLEILARALAAGPEDARRAAALGLLAALEGTFDALPASRPQSLLALLVPQLHAPCPETRAAVLRSLASLSALPGGRLRLGVRESAFLRCGPAGPASPAGHVDLNPLADALVTRLHAEPLPELVEAAAEGLESLLASPSSSASSASARPPARGEAAAAWARLEGAQRGVQLLGALAGLHPLLEPSAHDALVTCLLATLTLPAHATRPAGEAAAGTGEGAEREERGAPGARRQPSGAPPSRPSPPAASRPAARRAALPLRPLTPRQIPAAVQKHAARILAAVRALTDDGRPLTQRQNPPGQPGSPRTSPALPGRSALEELAVPALELLHALPLAAPRGEAEAAPWRLLFEALLPYTDTARLPYHLAALAHQVMARCYFRCPVHERPALAVRILEGLYERIRATGCLLAQVAVDLVTQRAFSDHEPSTAWGGLPAPAPRPGSRTRSWAQGNRLISVTTDPAGGAELVLRRPTGTVRWRLNVPPGRAPATPGPALDPSLAAVAAAVGCAPAPPAPARAPAPPPPQPTAGPASPASAAVSRPQPIVAGAHRRSGSAGWAPPRAPRRGRGLVGRGPPPRHDRLRRRRVGHRPPLRHRPSGPSSPAAASPRPRAPPRPSPPPAPPGAPPPRAPRHAVPALRADGEPRLAPARLPPAGPLRPANLRPRPRGPGEAGASDDDDEEEEEGVLLWGAGTGTPAGSAASLGDASSAASPLPPAPFPPPGPRPSATLPPPPPPGPLPRCPGTAGRAGLADALAPLLELARLDRRPAPPRPGSRSGEGPSGSPAAGDSSGAAGGAAEAPSCSAEAEWAWGAADPRSLFLQLQPLPFTQAAPQALRDGRPLERALQLLDHTCCVYTHSFGVLYVGPGQRLEAEILDNTHGSLRYSEFLRALGRVVRLQDCGGTYTAGLDRSPAALDGELSIAWSDPVAEVMHHVATLMPTGGGEASRTNKKRHIGNDLVTIVWSEGGEAWSPETLPGAFNLVHVVVYPLDDDFYRVEVMHKAGLPRFGPVPAARPRVVSSAALAPLVRLAALHGNLAAHIFVYGNEYRSNWVERLCQIKRVSERLGVSGPAPSLAPAPEPPVASLVPPASMSGLASGVEPLARAAAAAGADAARRRGPEEELVPLDLLHAWFA
eukprot:tig00020614_g12172.t1